jgi:hypothetical protein
MASYLIGYDLKKPGKDYASLIEAIKNLGSDWWHCLDSTWIIKHDGPSVAIRDALSRHIDPRSRRSTFETGSDVSLRGPLPLSSERRQSQDTGDPAPGATLAHLGVAPSVLARPLLDQRTLLHPLRRGNTSTPGEALNALSIETAELQFLERGRRLAIGMLWRRKAGSEIRVFCVASGASGSLRRSAKT